MLKFRGSPYPLWEYMRAVYVNQLFSAACCRAIVSWVTHQKYDFMELKSTKS